MGVEATVMGLGFFGEYFGLAGILTWMAGTGAAEAGRASAIAGASSILGSAAIGSPFLGGVIPSTSSFEAAAISVALMTSRAGTSFSSRSAGGAGTGSGGGALFFGRV